MIKKPDAKIITLFFIQYGHHLKDTWQIYLKIKIEKENKRENLQHYFSPLFMHHIIIYFHIKTDQTGMDPPRVNRQPGRDNGTVCKRICQNMAHHKSINCSN